MNHQGELWLHSGSKRRCWLGRFNTEKFTNITILPRPGLFDTFIKAFSPVCKASLDLKCKIV